MTVRVFQPVEIRAYHGTPDEIWMFSIESTVCCDEIVSHPLLIRSSRSICEKQSYRNCVGASLVITYPSVAKCLALD